MCSTFRVVGAFGPEDIPIRPDARWFPTPTGGIRLEHTKHCLRGHALVPGQMRVSWHAGHRLPELTCWTCWHTPETRDRAAWVLIDPYQQQPPATAETLGARLVALPPAVPAGIGRIELRLDRRAIAAAEVTLCGTCHRGVLEHVRTDPDYQRRGYGRTVVTAAMVRGPGYNFSTTTLEPGTEPFWNTLTRTHARLALGDPQYCEHMRNAWDTTP